MSNETPEWMEVRARELRAEGRLYREIGAMFGRSTKWAWRCCNAEWERETNARYRDANRERRRAWDRAHYERSRGVCEGCGGRLGRSHQKSVTGLCMACVLAEHERKLSLVERLYNDGASLKEISMALGYGRRSVPGALLDELRKTGRIGYRHKGYGKHAGATQAVASTASLPGAAVDLAAPAEGR